MKRARIGIIGGAEIAYRRFIPAVLKSNIFQCIQLATKDPIKKEKFIKNYGISIVDTYEEIINNPDIDIVYIPLPPALHYEWAKKALENNKHVLLEKPGTTDFNSAVELVEIAKNRGLVLHENYMFQYHNQVENIKSIIAQGKIGDIRLIRSNFGFPLREVNDFRYNREPGGGALLDAGGYVIKLATLFLGPTIEVQTSSSNYMEGFEVDMFGSVSFKNEKNLTFQGAYGLDCHYQCNIEVWGSKGKLYTNRIFTAPPEYTPKIFLEVNGDTKEISIQEEDTFLQSINKFGEAISNHILRKKMYKDLVLQAKLMQKIQNR